MTCELEHVGGPLDGKTIEVDPSKRPALHSLRVWVWLTPTGDYAAMMVHKDWRANGPPEAVRLGVYEPSIVTTEFKGGNSWCGLHWREYRAQGEPLFPHGYEHPDPGAVIRSFLDDHRPNWEDILGPGESDGWKGEEGG